MTYDEIGIGYDSTRRPDRRIAERLLALLAPRAGGHYLDAACGTGNYASSLHALGLDVVGIDQSKTMLDAARVKDPAMTWREADVTALPFPDGHFDGIICTQAIHHFSDLEAAFCELARVLGGGRLVIFTATRQQMRRYWLNACFPEALARAIDQIPSDQRLVRAFDQAKLRIVTREPWFVPTDPVDLFLYSGKHNANLYLNARVRQGISTFAKLADAQEVAHGLVRLKNDIATGAIAQVMARYVSDAGDYQFVVARTCPPVGCRGLTLDPHVTRPARRSPWFGRCVRERRAAGQRLRPPRCNPACMASAVKGSAARQRCALTGDGHIATTTGECDLDRLRGELQIAVAGPGLASTRTRAAWAFDSFAASRLKFHHVRSTLGLPVEA